MPKPDKRYTGNYYNNRRIKAKLKGPSSALYRQQALSVAQTKIYLTLLG